MRTLTKSRQQRVLLRLLSSAYAHPGWVLTPSLMAFHCEEEDLSAPEAVRLTEDVCACGVALYRLDGSTLVALGAAEATGEVRAAAETAELRAQARRARRAP